MDGKERKINDTSTKAEVEDKQINEIHGNSISNSELKRNWRKVNPIQKMKSSKFTTKQ